MGDTGCAGNRCRDARLRHDPGQRDLGRGCLVTVGHRIQRRQKRQPARIEVFVHPFAPHGLRQVRRRAVLSRQEPRGEAEIGDHPHIARDAKVAQIAFEPVPVVKVVFRLQDLIGGQASARQIQRMGQLARIQI